MVIHFETAKNFCNRKILLPVFLFIFLGSCAPLISTFDQYAYIQTTSLKVDALNLMDRATEDYTAHEQEVKAVLTKLDKAYE